MPGKPARDFWSMPFEKKKENWRVGEIMNNEYHQRQIHYFSELQTGESIILDIFKNIGDASGKEPTCQGRRH